ncbi:MAG: acyltransferase [Frateuria sp.]|nr:acyltransferase [Frateuria sp.]
MKDSPNLDLLRSIAVLLVVLSHATPFIGGQALVESYNFMTFGHIGVALFFVHTVLVLMQSLERSGDSAMAFYLRRVFRIYPLAVTMVLVMVLLRLRFGEPVALSTVAANLLLVQNLTGDISMPDQLWTLPFEVQMYLLLPALFMVARSRRPLLWVATICAGALALGLALFYTVWHGRTGVVTPWHYIPCFLPGVLAYVLTNRARGTLSPLVLFAYIMICAAGLPLLVTAGIAETPLFWGLCLGLGLLIPACREIDSPRIASAAKVVATYSYGIYLTHTLALGLSFAGGRGLGHWLLLAVLLPGLPFVAYRVIERPGIALGRRLAAAYSARISAPRPAAISPPASSA